ncbi:hypothetical protein HJC23_002183 [Cyclotella cryptica]|uniref:Uncharacterized protein n=1 Tax=Cyclotella cryptica TaxID=29204 RepID=A0ABD3Q692_9STRA
MKTASASIDGSMISLTDGASQIESSRRHAPTTTAPTINDATHSLSLARVCLQLASSLWDQHKYEQGQRDQATTSQHNFAEATLEDNIEYKAVRPTTANPGMFIRNLPLFVAFCAGTANGFSSPLSLSTPLVTSLQNSYLDSIGPERDPRRPQSGRYEEPPSVDLDGRVVDRQSNLFFRRDPNYQSVNEDPRRFDMERRSIGDGCIVKLRNQWQHHSDEKQTLAQGFGCPWRRNIEGTVIPLLLFSQRPMQPPRMEDPNMRPRQAWWDSGPMDTRIQGGSRRTFNAPYDRDLSHVFLETDGRPLDTEIELWDGPNNTPTRLKVYSEDGRMRPINAMIENPLKGMRGNTMSVRNTGPMEFPINAGVGSVGGSTQQFRSGMSLAGSEGAYLTERDLNGYTRPSPSKARGETVQGGALRTFPLDYSVEAVQVTLTTDGLPMNAKVELWGTSSHIKQVAEIYNDNGQSRPFAAIVDTPGGSNTIAIYNTGPMEYPIKAVVEPIARIDGWNGSEEKFGGSLAPW